MFLVLLPPQPAAAWPPSRDRPRVASAAPRSSAFGEPARRESRQQRGEIRQRVHDTSGGKSEFFLRLSRTTLNPERVQSRGTRAVDVPIVRGHKPCCCRGDFEMGGNQLVNLRRRFERLDVLDANDRVEEPSDAGALRRRLEHFGFAVREDGETDALLLEG